MAGYEKHIDYDNDLEKAVLGIILLEPYAYSKIHGLLNEECFYMLDNQKVYKTIKNMWKLGQQIDLMSVSRRMCDKGHTVMDDHSETPYYLSCLCSEVVQGAHLQQWCMMLRELAVRREVIKISKEGIGADDPLAATERIQQQLEKALTVNATNDWIDASMAAMQLTEHMDSVKGKIVGVPTGISLIDKINGGFRGGQLIVLGARPAVGKSAFAGLIASNIAKNGVSVGVVSLEMPARDIFARLVSSESTVPYGDIDKNTLEAIERDRVSKAISELSVLPIYFSDTAKTNIYDIRAKAELLKEKHKIGALVLDYLQLVDEVGGKNRNRENAIAEISRGLKMLAMNMDIPVVALSQLNRDSEKRGDKKPTKSDLRESGSLEQDADVVMLLHRPYAVGIEHNEHGKSTLNDAELLIDKWRNGTPLKIDLHFEPETMTFSEVNTIQGVEVTPQPKANAGMQKAVNKQYNDTDLPF